jgi:hypothetical protein
MAEPDPLPEKTCPIPLPDAPHPSKRGMALRVGVAVVAFLLVQIFLRAIASPGGGSMVGSKVEHFQQEAARYDTVFVGTSHVYRSFVPDEFDRILSEQGRSSSSFNLGLQFPNQIELHYLFRTVLEAGEGHLERVFVQYYAAMPQIDPEQAFKARNVYWHDWEGARVSIDRARALDDATPGGIELAVDKKRRHAILAILERQFPSKWFLTREHFQHWVKREMLVARNKDVARGLLGRDHGLTALWGPTRGYLSLEQSDQRRASDGDAGNVISLRREIFLEDQTAFLDHIERLRTESRVWGDTDWMNPEVQRFSDAEVYRLMAEQARAAGVELVVVVMPSNSCDRPFEEALAAELGVPVLRYNLPDAYPRFYDPALRFDSGHLNAEGALEFTRVLAQEYLSLKSDR